MKMTFHSHANSLSSQERVRIYLRFDRDGFWNSEMACYASSEGKLWYVYSLDSVHEKLEVLNEVASPSKVVHVWRD